MSPVDIFSNEYLVIFGTRPEAIKLALVVKELLKHSALTLRVCVTGQHRELLDQFLNIFDIKPDFYLHSIRKGRILSKSIACIKYVMRGRERVINTVCNQGMV